MMHRRAGVAAMAVAPLFAWACTEGAGDGENAAASDSRAEAGAPASHGGGAAGESSAAGSSAGEAGSTVSPATKGADAGAIAETGAAALVDAGVLTATGFVRYPRTPGAIYCRYDGVDLPDGGIRDCVAGAELCCVGMTAPPYGFTIGSRCVALDADASCQLRYSCEADEDCGGGLHCCVTIGQAKARSYCAASCAGGDAPTCKRTGDCAGAASCCHARPEGDAAAGSLVALGVYSPAACIGVPYPAVTCDAP